MVEQRLYIGGVCGGGKPVVTMDNVEEFGYGLVLGSGTGGWERSPAASGSNDYMLSDGSGWAPTAPATVAAVAAAASTPDGHPMAGPMAIVAMFCVLAACVGVVLATRLSHTEDGQAQTLLLGDDTVSDESTL